MLDKVQRIGDILTDRTAPDGLAEIELTPLTNTPFGAETELLNHEQANWLLGHNENEWHVDEQSNGILTLLEMVKIFRLVRLRSKSTLYTPECKRKFQIPQGILEIFVNSQPRAIHKDIYHTEPHSEEHCSTIAYSVNSSRNNPTIGPFIFLPLPDFILLVKENMNIFGDSVTMTNPALVSNKKPNNEKQMEYCNQGSSSQFSLILRNISEKNRQKLIRILISCPTAVLDDYQCGTVVFGSDVIHGFGSSTASGYAQRTKYCLSRSNEK